MAEIKKEENQPAAIVNPFTNEVVRAVEVSPNSNLVRVKVLHPLEHAGLSYEVGMWCYLEPTSAEYHIKAGNAVKG